MLKAKRSFNQSPESCKDHPPHVYSGSQGADLPGMKLLGDPTHRDMRLPHTTASWLPSSISLITLKLLISDSIFLNKPMEGKKTLIVKDSDK